MIRIRYAATDDDVINIHRFLLLIASPTLPGPVDAKASIEEVWRVCTHEAAFIAFDGDGRMVGTTGIIRPKHWWGDVFFLTNRWCFAIPNSGAWRPMLKEARAVARKSGLEFMLISEGRGRLAVFNRSKFRDRHASSGNAIDAINDGNDRRGAGRVIAPARHTAH